MKRILLLTAFALCTAAAQAADIYAYGAGGPAPAIKAAAEAFNQSSGNTVHVDFGPTPKWIEAAKQNADIVFSGSSYMMADYVKAMEGRIDETSIRPLYLRPAVIVVRKGNPKKIRGFKDLLKLGAGIPCCRRYSAAGAHIPDLPPDGSGAHRQRRKQPRSQSLCGIFTVGTR